MKLLFLVPARGSSKGLPGKNLMALDGVPLVGRAVRTGRQVAAEFGGSRVVCSTDDPAIADAARAWGAETPFVRPVSLATDEARTLDVVIHALDQIQETFEAVVLLQPTSPLVQAEDVRGAIELFRHAGAPVVSVCPAEHPIEWYHRIDDNGRLVPLLSVGKVHQRQRAAQVVRPNGAVYVAAVEQVRAGGFWTADTRAFVMPADRSVDIDTAMDFEFARVLLERRPIPST
jgi:CMP-N-acetylneuraminic acid synthetase